MTRHAGSYVALAGLLAAVLAGVPAVALLATFGSERNWVFDARDDAFRLAALAALGVAALCVGVGLTRSGDRRPVAALWLLLCLGVAAATSWDSFPALPLAL